MTAANLATVLPLLVHPADVLTEVSDLVSNGHIVTIPRTTVSLGTWEGSAWIAEDPASGAAGYFISRALAGGGTTENFPPPLTDEFRDPYAFGINPSPFGGTSILPVSGNFQFGRVDEDSELIRFIVRDALEDLVIPRNLREQQVIPAARRTSPLGPTKLLSRMSSTTQLPMRS